MNKAQSQRQIFNYLLQKILQQNLQQFQKDLQMITCLKGISGLGAFLILLVGLAMTGITIYGYAHSEFFLDDTSNRNSILGVMITADILIVLGSIMGIWGIKKGNAFLICIFQIFVIIFLIVFFSLGIAAQVLPSKFFQGQCSKSDNPTVQLAYNVSLRAQTQFCRLCPCTFNQQDIKKYSDADKKSLGIYFNRNDNGASAFQKCYLNNSLVKMSQQQRDMGEALGAVEELFDCAGWCDGMPAINLIYLFSGVKKGKPQTNYCYNKLKDQLTTYGHVVGLGALITSGFLLLICIINTCICCHPSRKGLKFKDRFVYMKDGQYERI